MPLPISLDQVSLPDRLPPLVLIAFTRPELLQTVLEGIRRQTLLPPQIIAFVDGARKPADQPLIQECIALLNDFSSTIPVQVVARPHNLGCDKNVISALTEVLAIEPFLVYLEDDTVPNRHCYDRLCRLLVAYRDYPEIFSVSAYASPIEGTETVAEFVASNRVFALGLGLWADRWQTLGLSDQPLHHNPFGQFYQIPTTVQTKRTLVNQFWLEKNQQTDWVISMTLAALHRGMKHIVPTVSLVHNIGFGHAQAKTYRGAEPDWINAKYDAEARPNRLPDNLELPKPLGEFLTGLAIAQYLQKQPHLWLHPTALWYFLRTYPDLNSQIAFWQLFWQRLLVMARRWRQGKLI
jgi:hypothetical protein